MGLASFSGHCWKGIDDRVGFWLIGRDRTRGVSARSVLMFRVTDADATPDTVDVSLHDTPDGDDLASAQLGSAGAEGGV